MRTKGLVFLAVACATFAHAAAAARNRFGEDRMVERMLEVFDAVAAKP